MVIENKSFRGEVAMRKAVASGYVIDGKWGMSVSAISEQKPSKMTENMEVKDQKPSNLTENAFPSMIVKNVYEAIKQNRKAKYSWLQDNLGVSESTVQRAIDELKKLGYISSERAKIKGEWQLLK